MAFDAEKRLSDTNREPVEMIAKQENFSLAAANVAGAAVTVRGGRYIFNQSATAYGSIQLRYRGPDGTTMLPLVTKTVTDAAGGTLVTLGANAVVDVVAVGTTAANATLDSAF